MKCASERAPHWDANGRRIGKRSVGTQKIGSEYVYQDVSLKPFTGEMFAMVLPRLNKECFTLFAEERTRTLADKILMVSDGATAHRLRDERIELANLSAYAPELNPVGRFFEQLRRELEFCVFKDLEQAEEYLTKALRKYYEQPELVKSLTLYPYIKDASLNLQ